MSVYEKLMHVQKKLKAPKSQNNTYGNYKYRSCEDILEAVKPLLTENKATLTVSDELEEKGTRIYIKATATFTDIEDGTSISNSAYAREPEQQKGMSESQLTGTASSYARKYALNGLFCIDDNKDADSDEYQGVVVGESAADRSQNNEWKKQGKDLIDDVKVKSLEKVCKNHKMPESELAKKYQKKKLSELTMTDYLDFAKTGQDFLDKWDKEHAG